MVENLFRLLKGMRDGGAQKCPPSRVEGRAQKPPAKNALAVRDGQGGTWSPRRDRANKDF